MTLLLPISPGDASWLPAASESTSPPVLLPRILVVDDEPMVGQAISRGLSSSFTVLSYTSSIEALSFLLDGEDVDLIICDLMMPHMSGMEFFARLSEHVPRLAQRVVFLTGGAFTGAARDFLESVPNTRVEKPFRLPELRKVIEEYLG